MYHQETSMSEYKKTTINNNDIKFSDDDMQKIKQGYKAKSMDDRWNIIYDDGWIRFERSWTNTLIYKVEINQKTRKTYIIGDVFYHNCVPDETMNEVEFLDLLNTYVLVRG